MNAMSLHNVNSLIFDRFRILRTFHVFDVSLELVDLVDLSSSSERPGASKLLLVIFDSFTSCSSFVIFNTSFIRW